MSLGPPSIPDNLRPHIWAKSMNTYPLYPNLPVQQIAAFLSDAINIASTIPFRWDFIDAPAPGSLIFVWMAPQTFASPPTDGYQYLDPENMLHLSVGDKTVEVYEHKYGYNPRTEGMTGYVRRRFHLVQGGNPQLWLIHYLRAPDEDRLPVTQAAPQPYPPRPFPLPKLADVSFTISNTGQLVSFKNQATLWPPPNMSAPPPQHYTPQGPPPPPHYMGRPPQQQAPPPAYRPQQVPPGNKRVKVEEEEDEEVFLPRDVAAQRFVRWTEWMEEILSSGYHIRDILPPPGPLDGIRPEMLAARTQSLENEIKLSKQRHEETLQKFKSSCKVWKDGTRKLSMSYVPTNTTNNPDNLATGVAAAAKDAESAVSLAMTQPSHLDEIEEINRQVLLASDIPHAKIRTVQRVRPVGKHIEFEPVKKVVMQHVVQQRTPIKEIVTSAEETPVAESKMGLDEEEEETGVSVDGHANEAFEAMEAMEFDANAEFDYDSENHGNNDDITMDMGVD